MVFVFTILMVSIPVAVVYSEVGLFSLLVPMNNILEFRSLSWFGLFIFGRLRCWLYRVVCSVDRLFRSLISCFVCVYCVNLLVIDWMLVYLMFCRLRVASVE